MARKKTGTKTPSGKFKVQLYLGKDENGNRKYKSFTASSRAEADAMAHEWKLAHGKNPNSLTVSEAVQRYISLKEPVLSPSTVVGYNKILRNQIAKYPIGSVDIRELDSTIVQMWISEISMAVSPKSVANASGLFSAAMSMFKVGPFDVTLPQKIKPDLYCPSSEDVSSLIETIKKADDKDMLIAVLLAAFGPLRRGELCCLTDKDIKGNVITVNKAMVLNKDKEYVIKQPKTYGSYRSVEFPDFVIDELRGRKGRLVQMTPDAVSEQFARYIKKAGLPHFRFHDLRHYSASILHAIGIPDIYILHRGGWSSDNVMKSIYRNNISTEEKRQTTKILDYFEKVNKQA